MTDSLSDVRAIIETKVSDAYAALTPSVPVAFDNVQETPFDLPYVVCIISYTTTTEPIICQSEAGLERLLGNLQLSCYAPKGEGMKQLEQLASVGQKVFNTMQLGTTIGRVRCGQANGPVSILSSSEPYAVATVSCSFDAVVY